MTSFVSATQTKKTKRVKETLLPFREGERHALSPPSSLPKEKPPPTPAPSGCFEVVVGSDVFLRGPLREWRLHWENQSDEIKPSSPLRPRLLLVLAVVGVGLAINQSLPEDENWSGTMVVASGAKKPRFEQQKTNLIDEKRKEKKEEKEERTRRPPSEVKTWPPEAKVLADTKTLLFQTMEDSIKGRRETSGN
jgi:hypothetical protein